MVWVYIQMDFFFFFYMVLKEVSHVCLSTSLGAPVFVISLKLKPPGSLPAAPVTLHHSLEGAWKGQTSA